MDCAVDAVSFHFYPNQLPPVLLYLQYAIRIVDHLVGRSDWANMDAIHCWGKFASPSLSDLIKNAVSPSVFLQDTSHPWMQSNRIRIRLKLSNPIRYGNLSRVVVNAWICHQNIAELLPTISGASSDSNHHNQSRAIL